MHTTISYTNLSVADLSFSTPREYKPRSPFKFQPISLASVPKYGDDFAPRIQGPWMNLDTYGTYGTYGFPGEMDRDIKGKPLDELELRKLKVPLSLNNPETKKFHEVLSAIDKKCKDDMEKNWKDKANPYKYDQLVCESPIDLWDSQSPEELEDVQQKPDYITLKFKNFSAYYLSNITEVYLNNDGVRSQVKTPTLDDVKKYVCDKCKFRAVFSLCLSGSYSPLTKKHIFGLELVLSAIEVKPMISITL
jgi:hypothetical protein